MRKENTCDTSRSLVRRMQAVRHINFLHNRNGRLNPRDGKEIHYGNRIKGANLANRRNVILQRMAGEPDFIHRFFLA